MLEVSDNELHAWVGDRLVPVKHDERMKGALCLDKRRRRTAASTSCGDPFDAHSVTDLDGTCLCTRAHFHYFADTLVAADLSCLSWVWENGPAE